MTRPAETDPYIHISNKAVFCIIMSPACGKKNENGISDYIINGQDTGPNEWPWMAAIVRGAFKTNFREKLGFCPNKGGGQAGWDKIPIFTNVFLMLP